DLIEFCGGIDIAKELDEEFLGENSQAVQQAIADYESIYQCKCVTTRTYENGTCNKCGLQDMGDDSDLEYHVSPLCKIEVK
ncbi:MAG: hypothetical protein RR676_17280, partial [Acinetobacter sp.]